MKKGEKNYPSQSAKKQAKRLRKIVRQTNPQTEEEALKAIKNNMPKKGLKKGVGVALRRFVNALIDSVNKRNNNTN